MTRTKILATIGPVSSTLEQMNKLVEAGASAFRLNFSHGTYDEFESIFNNINEVCTKNSLPIPIIQDLQGPKIRVGTIENNEVFVEDGDEIEVTAKAIRGNKKVIPTSYTALPKDSKIGDIILIDDGLISLEIIAKSANSVICKVISGGAIRTKKGMNLPGMKLSAASVTEKDLMDIEFALSKRVDYIALSFVRHPDDIAGLKDWLRSKKKDIPVIAKIEKPEAVEKFESILKVADGIMVARGDLGVEIAPEKVPVIQKNIIRRCNEEGKLVITATQMLESMIENPIPTRAEASDVANAVLDGTDVVMLSGETAVGKYPAKAVKMMNKILMNAESQKNLMPKINFSVPDDLVDNLFDSTGKAFVGIADQINAKAIIVFTSHGRKAKVLSKFRPNAPIFAFSDSFETLNYLNLSRSIMPFFLAKCDDQEICVKESVKILKERTLVSKGDLVVLTSGAPLTDKGRKNWIQYILVE